MYKYIRGGGKNPSQTSLAELRFNSVTSPPPPPPTTSERPLPIRLEATVSVGRKEIVPTAPAFFFFVRNKCFNSCHLGLDCSRAANGGTDQRAVQNARANQNTHTKIFYRKLERCLSLLQLLSLRRSAGKEKERRAAGPLAIFSSQKARHTDFSHFRAGHLRTRQSQGDVADDVYCQHLKIGGGYTSVSGENSISDQIRSSAVIRASRCLARVADSIQSDRAARF